MVNSINKEISRGLLNNSRGETSLLGIVFITITLSTMTYFFKVMIHQHQMTKLRLDTYLCFKQGVDQLRNTYDRINQANIAIIGFNSAKIVSPIPLWDILKRLAQAGQEFFHLEFKRNILSNQSCSFLSKYRFAKSFPYQVSPFQLLTRGPGGLTLIKKIKSKIKIIAIKNLRPYFSLHAHYTYSVSFKLLKTFEKKLIGSHLDSLRRTSSSLISY